MDTSTAVSLMRSQIENALLQDTCQIFPRYTTTSVSATGKPVVGSATARVWRGTTNIPCRLDAARAFRPDRIPQQAGDVNEQYINLPFDVTIEASDIIVFGAHRYEVRKINETGHFDGVKEVLVMEFTGNVDNPT